MHFKSILAATLFHGALVVGVGIGLYAPQEPRPTVEVALMLPAPEQSWSIEQAVVVDVTPETTQETDFDEPPAAPPAPAPAPAPAEEALPKQDVEPVFSMPSSLRTAPELMLSTRPPKPVEPPPPVAAAASPVSTSVAIPDVPARARDDQNEPPRYPARAGRAGVVGSVLLRVHVDATGEVERVELLESAGLTALHKSLDRAAIAAVCKWRYEPARRGGVAVRFAVDVPVEFRGTPCR